MPKRKTHKNAGVKQNGTISVALFILDLIIDVVNLAEFSEPQFSGTIQRTCRAIDEPYNANTMSHALTYLVVFIGCSCAACRKHCVYLFSFGQSQKSLNVLFISIHSSQTLQFKDAAYLPFVCCRYFWHLIHFTVANIIIWDELCRTWIRSCNESYTLFV